MRALMESQLSQEGNFSFVAQGSMEIYLVDWYGRMGTTNAGTTMRTLGPTRIVCVEQAKFVDE